MANNSEMVAVYLDAAAAKAKQLAEDVRRRKLWPGDLKRGISDAIQQLQAASREAHNV
jgi:hypothetical protein